MLGLALKLGKLGVTALAKGLPRNTILSKGLRAAGFAGAGAAAGYIAQPRTTLPALPSTAMQIPSAGSTPMPGQFQNVGLIPWWRGAGGKLQFPWQDPKMAEHLKQFALDDAYLKISYRAPRGYVVVRDPSGKPYCLLKQAAKFFGLWTAPRKPPISAGDWHQYQTAHRVVKKLRKIANTGLAKKPAKAMQGKTYAFKRKAA